MNNRIKVADFAKKRNVDNQTVTKYLSRHSDEFEGHVQKEGKNIFLDNTAIKLLSQKYPMPVEKIIDQDILIQLDEAKEQIIILQQRLLQAAEDIALAEQNRFKASFFEKENQIFKSENNDLKIKNDNLRVHLEQTILEKQELQIQTVKFDSEKMQLLKTIDELKTENQFLKNRKLFSRIFNKMQF